MSKKKIAVIGGGPAGFFAAITAAESAQVDIFEQNVPLKTILCTGNGRCNLANNIMDFKELALHYPGREKFVYSVFSRFSTKETLDWFYSRGLKTYVQPDNRIFPVSNMASTVRELLLDEARKKGVKIIKTLIKDAPLKDYDAVILATGGKGTEIARKAGHTITKLKPALTALITDADWIKGLSGVSVKNACVKVIHNKKKISELTGDFIFTHQGISGPVIFDTSLYTAYLDLPYYLNVNFAPEYDISQLEDNKAISNILKNIIPKSLAVNLLSYHKLNPDKKGSELTQKEKQQVLNLLQSTEIKIVSPAKEGEIITAGGVDLKEINLATMQSKLSPKLYFCGEILDIQGLTGGFNLQLCWSTGYIAGINAIAK